MKKIIFLLTILILLSCKDKTRSISEIVLTNYQKTIMNDSQLQVFPSFLIEPYVLFNIKLRFIFPLKNGTVTINNFENGKVFGKYIITFKDGKPISTKDFGKIVYNEKGQIVAEKHLAYYYTDDELVGYRQHQMVHQLQRAKNKIERFSVAKDSTLKRVNVAHFYPNGNLKNDSLFVADYIEARAYTYDKEQLKTYNYTETKKEKMVRKRVYKHSYYDNGLLKSTFIHYEHLNRDEIKNYIYEVKS